LNDLRIVVDDNEDARPLLSERGKHFLIVVEGDIFLADGRGDIT